MRSLPVRLVAIVQEVESSVHVCTAGLADGAGVDYQTLLRIHMIGELTQVSCCFLTIE